MISNGSVGSDCNEAELTPVVDTTPVGVELGEGLDGFVCQAFIWANVSVSGCTVSGVGGLTFQEDNPVGGAAGGQFDFTVSGPASRSLMKGTNAAPGGGTDVTVGTLSLANDGLAIGPANQCGWTGFAKYTATVTYVVP